MIQHPVPRLEPIATPLPPALATELADYSRASHPAEAVAAVFVDQHGGHHLRRLANRHTTPEQAFRVDAIEFAVVEVAERRAGRRLCAWFHSHPDGSATPSADDLAAAWSGVETWIGAIRTDGSFELARFRAGGRS